MNVLTLWGRFLRLKIQLALGDVDKRLLVVTALPEFRDAGAVKPLLGALADDSYLVREAAAEALGKLGDARAIAPLIDRLADDLTVRVFGISQEATTTALDRIDPAWRESEAARAALPALLRRLNDEDPIGREVAAAALGELRDPLAVEPLVARLVDNATTSVYGTVREAATAALERIDPVWRESEAARAAVPALLRRLDDEYEVRKVAAEALAELRDVRAVAPLIDRLNDNDPVIRKVAAEALERIDPAWRESEAVRMAVPALLRRLEDGSYDIREAATEALERIDLGWWESEVARAAAPALLRRLNDEDLFEQNAAAETLGKLGDVRAIAPLIEKLNDRSSTVRRAAAAALERIDSSWRGSEAARMAVPALLRRLSDDDESVRWVAAEALGELGDARAVAPLIDRLNDDDYVRGVASVALSKLGDARAVAPLIDRLADCDPTVRLVAAEALGKFGDAQAVAPLIDRLVDNVGMYGTTVREAATAALERIDPSWRESEAARAAVPALLQRLNDDEYEIREVAAEALCELRDTRAVVPLIDRLKDNYHSIREVAAKALGALGDARAVAPLITALADGNSILGKAAMAALERIDPSWRESEAARAAVPTLLQRLGDDNFGVRRGASMALGEFGDARAVAPLIDRLADPDSTVRWVAAASLERIDPTWRGSDAARAAVPVLLRRLNDNEDDVREAAMGALEQIDPSWRESEVARAAVPALLRRLNDDDEYRVRGVVASLGDLGDTRAVAPLVGALTNDSQVVREAAAEALGKLGDAQVVVPLIDRLNDGVLNVRNEAAFALVRIGVQTGDPLAVMALVIEAKRENMFIYNINNNIIENILDKHLDHINSIVLKSITSIRSWYIPYGKDMGGGRSDTLIDFSRARELAQQELLRREMTP